MRADRSLLASAIFLGAGLSILLRYGTSGATVNSALTWSNLGFHLSLGASGPAAVGGAALVVTGLLLLLWSILAALAFNAALLFEKHDDQDFLHILPSSSGVDEDEESAAITGHRRYL